MLAKRIIGVVLCENGNVVRRVRGKTAAIVGSPAVTIKYLADWNVDEICFINLSGQMDDTLQLLEISTENLFLPLSFGGQISSLEQANLLLKNGAEKIVIGRHKSPELIKEIGDKHGKQAVVVSIDSNWYEDSPRYSELAGEIILHDFSRDGLGNGLNLELAKIDTECPKILMGGVGSYGDIVNGLRVADGVAVGNMFHYKELSATMAKRQARSEGIFVR